MTLQPLRPPRFSSAAEWLPRPWAGKIMIPSRAKAWQRDPAPESKRAPVTLMVVPGPPVGVLNAPSWQVVRLELERPVARGFATPEQARAWIGRAVRAGVLPSVAVEVEPPETPGTETAQDEP